MNGQRLKSLREEAGLTLEAFGQEFGLSASMVAHMERGNKTPSVEIVKKIAKRFNVTVDELVND